MRAVLIHEEQQDLVALSSTLDVTWVSNLAFRALRRGLSFRFSRLVAAIATRNMDSIKQA